MADDAVHQPRVPPLPEPPLLPPSSHGHSHGGHGHSHGSLGSGSEQNAREMLAGGIAGLSEHFVTFPFDTIKTRMQSAVLSENGTRPSFWRTFRTLVRDEPVRNLYRGCAPVLASSFPAHAAYFAMYEETKRFIEADSSMGYAAASIFAALGHDSVSVPFDVVKQHMQVDGHRNHRSSLECLRCVVRNNGVFALFKSLPTTVAMNVPHMATHWMVYEEMKVILDLGNEESFEAKYLIAGAAAGACAAAVSTPLDVVKTQLQLGKSRSFAEASRRVYQESGLRGFTRGAVPRMLTLAPSAAVVMATYEAVKAVLGLSTIAGGGH